MKWQKAPPEHIEAFHATLLKAPGVELCKMFGCPAGFVNSNMFCGAHESSIVVRLEEKARDRALRQAGFGPFTVMGRTMKEYVCLPPNRRADVAYLKRWFKKGLDYLSSLSPKVKNQPGRGQAAATVSLSDHGVSDEGPWPASPPSACAPSNEVAGFGPSALAPRAQKHGAGQRHLSPNQ